MCLFEVPSHANTEKAHFEHSCKGTHLCSTAVVGLWTYIRVNDATDQANNPTSFCGDDVTTKSFSVSSVSWLERQFGQKTSNGQGPAYSWKHILVQTLRYIVPNPDILLCRAIIPQFECLFV